MALLFMDGFDADDASIKWDILTTASVSTSSPRFAGGRYISVSSSGSMLKNITASSQVTVGFAFNVAGASGECRLSIRGDAAATTHLTFMRNTSSGFMEVRRGTATGTLLATGTKPILIGVWYYLECQATINDATGTAIVRINGDTTPDINFTGDTKNAGTATTIDQVGFLSGSLGVDDLYILNSTGSSNTTFLGDVRIHTLSPSGNGNSSQLTGSDGNSVDNYAQVDEIPYSTADYNGSATIGQKDTYAMSDLPANVSSIFGVQNNMIAAKSDATAASARTVLRTASTDYTGTTQSLSTSYINYRDIYNVNPNTSAAWSVSEVNGLESGMEVQ